MLPPLGRKIERLNITLPQLIITFYLLELTEVLFEKLTPFINLLECTEVLFEKLTWFIKISCEVIA